MTPRRRISHSEPTAVLPDSAFLKALGTPEAETAANIEVDVQPASSSFTGFRSRAQSDLHLCRTSPKIGCS